jgi:hypothetical protein
MVTQHVVVDGSNIATEGRSLPSLAQLESAITELRKEMPDAEVTVVVDATFAHRIDPSELARFEAAAARGEYVSPPAGAIGRGDAFLLRIAEKVGGIALSNDSFQEFHGEHGWLFDTGRLLGATPVPGVGWIFIPRTPVRGPRSRVAVRDTKRAKDRVVQAIAAATKEAVDPAAVSEGDAAPVSSSRRRTRTKNETPQAVNDPTTFIAFIAEHPLGEQIEGEVDSFTSHGAVVRYGDVRCYAPLSGLGNPPPRSAREVLRRGDTRTFVITALDPYRRGIELALPDLAVVSGRPSEETVEAEVEMARRSRRATGTSTPRGSSASAAETAPRRTRRTTATVSEEPPSPPVTVRRASTARSSTAQTTSAATTRRRAPTKEAPTLPASTLVKKTSAATARTGAKTASTVSAGAKSPAPTTAGRTRTTTSTPTTKAAPTTTRAGATSAVARAGRTTSAVAKAVSPTAPATPRRATKQPAAASVPSAAAPQPKSGARKSSRAAEKTVSVPARRGAASKARAASTQEPAAPAPATRARKSPRAESDARPRRAR